MVRIRVGDVDLALVPAVGDPEISAGAEGERHVSDREGPRARSKALPRTPGQPCMFGSSMSRRVLAILPVLVGLSWADGSDAHAEGDGENEEPVVVEYRAPPGCPTEEAFIDQLRRRGIRAPLAAPGEKARTFQIDVKTETRPHGRLTVIGLDGKRVTRTVAGRSCEELVSGLAVMTAVAISPLALAEPPPEPEPPAPTPSPAPPASAPPPEPPMEAPRSKEAPPQPRAAAQIEVGTGIRVFSLLTVAPEPILGAGVFVDLQRARASLRVGIDQTLPDTIGDGFAQARFAWTTARAELCPTFVSFGALSFAPCAVLDLGVVRATDSRGDHPQDDLRFWATAGGLARVRFAMTRRWYVELGPALTATLSRDSFILRPSSPIYKPAPVGAEVGLALGVDL